MARPYSQEMACDDQSCLEGFQSHQIPQLGFLCSYRKYLVSSSSSGLMAATDSMIKHALCGM